MITLFTGMPGAGKTASMLDLLMQVMGDRPIYVHYDPSAKKRPDQVVLAESLRIPHEKINANDWTTQLPDGAILLIDEVQDVWRPRGPGAKVPDAIAALETHRHAGIDFFLTTQAPRLVDANVRSLVNRHVHIRDTGWLGRHWYEWPETNEGLNWKACPVKKRYKLPKKVFEVYQSATIHTAQVRTTPIVFYVAGGAVLLAVGLGLYAAKKIASRNDVPPVPPASMAAEGLQVKSSKGGTAGPIDDRVDWTPRSSSRPESAPAYDSLRVVVAMPVVVGGYCQGDRCVCMDQQGRDSRLTSTECRDWIKNPPFNPYKAPELPTQEKPAPKAPPPGDSMPSVLAAAVPRS